MIRKNKKINKIVGNEKFVNIDERKIASSIGVTNISHERKMNTSIGG